MATSSKDLVAHRLIDKEQGTTDLITWFF